MQISFREFDPFNLWIWIEFNTVPSEMEKQYIEEVFNSWFFLGKLGGFNAENLQVQDVGIDISYMDYDDDNAENSMQALMHNISDVEYEGNWGRVWVDAGTSDGIAIDVLINALRQFSKDYVNLNQVIVGGENEDWAVGKSDRRSSFLPDNEYN